MLITHKSFIDNCELMNSDKYKTTIVTAADEKEFQKILAQVKAVNFFESPSAIILFSSNDKFLDSGHICDFNFRTRIEQTLDGEDTFKVFYTYIWTNRLVDIGRAEILDTTCLDLSE